MANIAGLYNQQTAESAPDTNFEPLPVGVYQVIITESEVKDTAAPGGKRLALTLEVVDGQFKSRKIFESLNLVNSNATAQAIAHKNFGEICGQIGLDPNQVADTSQMHFKPFNVKTKVDVDTRDPNDIKKYTKVAMWASKGATGAAPAVSTDSPQQAAPAQAAATPAGDPW